MIFESKCKEWIKINKELQLNLNQATEELNNERNKQEKEITKITKILYNAKEKLDNIAVVLYLVIK